MTGNCRTLSASTLLTLPAIFTGSLDLESMDWYRMTVLDTLFIRHSERRKGYAISAVEDVLQEFSDQNIGFSMPISLPMIQGEQLHMYSCMEIQHVPN